MRIEDYNIISEIRYGGKYSIFKAWCEKLGKYVLLKFLIINPSDFDDISRLRFLDREILVLKNLSKFKESSKYIPEFYDYLSIKVSKDKYVYINVIEYIDGVSLENYKTSSFIILLEIMIEIVKSIQWLHSKGYAHRNLKPGNILLYLKRKEIRLIDFEFAYDKPISSNLRIPYWKSPESFFEPPKTIEKAKSCDIWSLGVIFYYILNLRLPYNSNVGNIDELRESVNGFISKSRYNKSGKIETDNAINLLINSILNRKWELRPSSSKILEDLLKIKTYFYLKRIKD